MSTQKIIHVFSIVLLFLLAISALAGGSGMIGDPQGKAFGWTTDMLRYSPFHNYLIPGIILFVMNGVVSMGMAILAIKKVGHYPLCVILQGYILTVWILIQVIMIRQVNLPDLIYGFAGILLITIGIFLLKYPGTNQLSD